jgi:hypothetical protein
MVAVVAAECVAPAPVAAATAAAAAAAMAAATAILRKTVTAAGTDDEL